MSDFLEISSATYVCRNLDFLMSTIPHKITVPAIPGLFSQPVRFCDRTRKKG